jgi:hypothetical protein
VKWKVSRAGTFHKRDCTDPLVFNRVLAGK